MDGDEIRAGRERKGWTQQQLAAAVGVGMRTIGNWERGESVPRNRAAMLREVLGGDDQNDDPIRSASEMALLAELMRRAAVRERSA